MTDSAQMNELGEFCWDRTGYLYVVADRMQETIHGEEHGPALTDRVNPGDNVLCRLNLEVSVHKNGVVVEISTDRFCQGPIPIGFETIAQRWHMIDGVDHSLPIELMEFCRGTSRHVAINAV